MPVNMMQEEMIYRRYSAYGYDDARTMIAASFICQRDMTISLNRSLKIAGVC